MSIKIYTDASSNLFKDVLDKKQADIYVLPMTVEIKDISYLCYEDKIDVQEFSKNFYELMKKGEKPKTSLPNPGFFQQKMDEEVKNGNEVLVVTLSSGISGTFQSCSMVANIINEENKKEVIKVIDSKTAGFGEGKIALYAFEQSKNIASLNELYDKVNTYVNRVRSEFFVDSLTYLANTGRVSSFTAKLGSILSIKPLLYGSPEGKIEVTSKVHGKIKAIKKLSEQVIDHIEDKNSEVFISHCNAKDDADKLASLLNEAGINNIHTYFYDFVTGAHVGPGTVAVFYEGKDRNI